jgi:hypothetical protein
MEGVAEPRYLRQRQQARVCRSRCQCLSGFVEALRVDLTSGAWSLEGGMRRIVHHELGQPSEVLRVEDGPSEPLGPNQVRVRLSYVPIHPGDLLGIMGAPAFGTPPTLGPAGGSQGSKAPAW